VVSNISGNSLQTLKPPLMPMETLLIKAFQQLGGYGTAWELRMCLYKASFVPTPSVTMAELIANECDFDNYQRVLIVPGGAILALPSVGYQGVSSTLAIWQFEPTSSPPVTGSAGGMFLLVGDVPPPVGSYRIGPVIPFDRPLIFSQENQGGFAPLTINVVN